jgi:hypothetical protein
LNENEIEKKEKVLNPLIRIWNSSSEKGGNIFQMVPMMLAHLVGNMDEEH